MNTPKTLQKWIEAIEDEVMYVNVKPYSHNIVSIALGAIAENYGREAANKVIEDLDLERLGWHTQKEEDEHSDRKADKHS